VKWLLDGPMCTFDVESTGVSSVNDRIVTASIVWVEPGKQSTVETWLINPGVEIPAEAQAVHGISTERAVAEGIEPPGALNQICASISRAMANDVPVVVMNAAYDLTMLDREARRHGVEPLVDRVGPFTHPVVDPSVLDKHLDPFRKGTRRLSDPQEGGLVEWYGVKMDGAHDSTFDALAAARVAWRIAHMTQWPHERLVQFYHDSPRHTHGYRFKPEEIADRFKDLALSTPTQLHAAQMGWKKEQAVGLRAYFEKQGKPVSDIHEAWPMLPLEEEP
jgi:DNA polymerase-3 subunit epsilon